MKAQQSNNYHEIATKIMHKNKNNKKNKSNKKTCRLVNF